MKYTPLIDVHKELGASMKEFAGYYMPIQYNTIKQEHLAVRNNVGLFDISHMGEFVIKGKNALPFLQRITVNDLEKLKTSKVQYNCLPNGKGGIVDDMVVYKYNDEYFMMVVNAVNIQKDWDWIIENNQDGAEIQDVSNQTSLLAVQGPDSTKVIQKITASDISDVSFFQFITTELAGIPDVLISKSGYTGENGYEIYTSPEHARHLWKHIMDAGKEFNMLPVGLGARDSLRLEAGLYLYGKDIDENTSPIEANMEWIVKFNKNSDFIDRDYLYKQKQKGTSHKLKGFEMLDKGIPRHNYEIYNEQGGKIGRVTSGTVSPVLNKGIGMGYVEKEYIETGSIIYIKIRKKVLPARIKKIPLHKN